MVVDVFVKDMGIIFYGLCVMYFVFLFFVCSLIILLSLIRLIILKMVIVIDDGFVD